VPCSGKADVELSVQVMYSQDSGFDPDLLLVLKIKKVLSYISQYNYSKLPEDGSRANSESSEFWY